MQDHKKSRLSDDLSELRKQLSVITGELEVVNEKLAESESLRGHFVSNIKNEINNPLTSIVGLARQIMGGNSLSEASVRNMAGYIFTEAFSLEYQLRNIFSASEIEAGEAVVNASEIDVDSLVLNVIDTFSHQARGKDVQVSYDPIAEVDGGVEFVTDIEKLQIVLSNLLANAIEYSKSGGTIEIVASVEDGRLTLSIKDSGEGIGAEKQNKIFDRFKQLDFGTSKLHKGHGLGLSVTKAFVEMLEGSITVTSAEETGSVFVVTIPEAGLEDEEEMFAVDGNVFVFEEEEF